MNHEQRALAKNAQKIQAVLDRYPEGVSLSDITGKTQLSSAAARAALKHMGAELEDGLWFDVAEPAVEQSGNAGEFEPVQSGSIPAPKSETGIPVSEQKQVVKAELVSSDTGLKTGDTAQINWSKAPDGATHWLDGEWIRWNGKFNKEDGLWDLDAWDDGCRWTESAYGFKGTLEDFVESGAIPRPSPLCTTPETKSDFAIALEAERQRVYDAAAIGGTAARLAELTGIPVDDVQMHLDVLIDDGAIVERPIIVAMSYRVAV